MAIALSVIVAAVRDTTQDETATYRVADTKMVDFWNRFMRGVYKARPELFSTIDLIPCTAAKTLQSLPAGGIQLIDIHRVDGGQAVTRCERRALDRFNPSWHSDTAGAAKNWMPHEADLTQFYIYPQAPAAQSLVGEWTKLPTDLTATANNIPSQLEPYTDDAHNFMVMCCEVRDDEAVLAARAEAFFKMFAAGMTASAQVRAALQGAEVQNGNQSPQ